MSKGFNDIFFDYIEQLAENGKVNKQIKAQVEQVLPELTEEEKEIARYDHVRADEVNSMEVPDEE
jgi:hypothetical protein